MDTTTETVQQVLSRQVIVPKWLSDVVAGLAPTDLVTVRRKVTPFGVYLMGVERA